MTDKLADVILKLKQVDDFSQLPIVLEKRQSNGFALVQNLFNMIPRDLSKGVKYGFEKALKDFQAACGSELFEAAVISLHKLQKQRQEEIKAECGECLFHVTAQPVGKILKARQNVTCYGEKSGDFVFASEDKANRLFYSLRDNSQPGVAWSSQNKNLQEFPELSRIFIFEHLRKKSCCYRVRAAEFEPVVSLGGFFNHEWVADHDIVCGDPEISSYSEIRRKISEDIWALTFRDAEAVKSFKHDLFKVKKISPSNQAFPKAVKEYQEKGWLKELPLQLPQKVNPLVQQGEKGR